MSGVSDEKLADMRAEATAMKKILDILTPLSPPEREWVLRTIKLGYELGVLEPKGKQKP